VDPDHVSIRSKLLSFYVSNEDNTWSFPKVNVILITSGFQESNDYGLSTTVT